MPYFIYFFNVRVEQHSFFKASFLEVAEQLGLKFFGGVWGVWKISTRIVSICLSSSREERWFAMWGSERLAKPWPVLVLGETRRT